MYCRIGYCQNFLSAKRHKLVANTFKNAKLRYADKKTTDLVHNFNLIQQKGGVNAANREILPTGIGRSARLRALRDYKGIGEKYAYSIMMDAYHPEFRDSIAVDQRIKNISRELGLPQGKYDDYVNFYQRAALKIGVDPWDLDRILYKFQKLVLECLRAGTAPTARMAQEALGSKS